MIIESGVLVFIGLVFLFIKVPRITALKLLGFLLTLDIAVSVLTLCVHWGTFSGVMAATVAGLMCSGFTSVARWMFGHIHRKKFHPGKLNTFNYVKGLEAYK